MEDITTSTLPEDTSIISDENDNISIKDFRNRVEIGSTLVFYTPHKNASGARYARRDSTLMSDGKNYVNLDPPLIP